jgi:hypothetical protein
MDIMMNFIIIEKDYYWVKELEAFSFVKLEA